ncbi:MAG: MBL fold metallo-hydrolase, partial [Verrucomicrobiales bacterium]|nr:MBL fold metallo-hydrolase [Verrucomicrobiales bacterium]
MSTHPALPLALALLATTAAVTATLNTTSLSLDRSTADGGSTLTATATPGTIVRFETSTDLANWRPLANIATPASGNASHTDTTNLDSRNYRAVEITTPTGITGDPFPTNNGPLLVYPVNHASFVATWNGVTIYNDPVGSANLYRDFPKADLILVGHRHGDHHSDSTIGSVSTPETRIIAPADVRDRMSTSIRNRTSTLANNATLGIPTLGLTVHAVDSESTCRCCCPRV